MHERDGNRLGALVRSRRESVIPKMSQAELGRLIGVDQRTVSNIEQGGTRTLSPDVANKLVAVLPVTMAELVRAMEYDLPERRSTLDETMLTELENAPEEVLLAVQLVLAGWRNTRQGQQRRVV